MLPCLDLQREAYQSLSMFFPEIDHRPTGNITSPSTGDSGVPDALQIDHTLPDMLDAEFICHLYTSGALKDVYCLWDISLSFALPLKHRFELFGLGLIC